VFVSCPAEELTLSIARPQPRIETVQAEAHTSSRVEKNATVLIYRSADARCRHNAHVREQLRAGLRCRRNGNMRIIHGVLRIPLGRDDTTKFKFLFRRLRCTRPNTTLCPRNMRAPVCSRRSQPQQPRDHDCTVWSRVLASPADRRVILLGCERATPMAGANDFRLPEFRG
jgi:hypothetical protein